MRKTAIHLAALLILSSGEVRAAPCDTRSLAPETGVSPCESVAGCTIPVDPGTGRSAVCDQSYEAALPTACELSCQPEVPGDPETARRCDDLDPSDGGDLPIGATPYCSGVPEHPPEASGTPPPNVVFLVSDDWGFPYYPDVLHGATVTDVWHDYFSVAPPGDPTHEPNRMKLPNLEAIAERGAYFPVAHQCASICAPGSSCLLVGRHPKDFEGTAAAPNGVIMSQTLPHRLRDRYCSIKTGKVWQGMFLEDTTPAVGYDFDTGEVSNNTSYQPGTTKRSLEEAACLMRKVNASYRPFFFHYQPVIPHPPSGFGTPADLDSCYGNDSPFYKLDGGTASVSQTYRKRQTYFDCGVGRLLQFLSDTPDERYPAATGKKLLDTTLLVYTTDNGNILLASKGSFSENGYRTPLIFTFFDRTDPSSPSNIQARSYRTSVASVLDVIPTVLEFANTSLSPPLATGPVPPLTGGAAKTPPAEHLGLPLRSALISASPTTVREKYLMGHFANSNTLATVRGTSQTYLRTRTYSWENPFDTSAMPPGACKDALTTPPPGPGERPKRFACKYYQKPVAGQSRCSQLLYSLHDELDDPSDADSAPDPDDPDEDLNLLADACSNPSHARHNDPCCCLYRNSDNALPPPPGELSIYSSLTCELVRWTRLDPSMEDKLGDPPDDGTYRGCAFQNTQSGDDCIDISACTGGAATCS
jgi:hypothetical protein